MQRGRCASIARAGGMPGSEQVSVTSFRRNHSFSWQLFNKIPLLHSPAPTAAFLAQLMVPSSLAGRAWRGRVPTAGRRNPLSLLPSAHRRCKAGWRAARVVLSTSSHHPLQPPAACWGWVNEQQSSRHNLAFTGPAAFGKSCQPPPCRQELQCSPAIPQLCSQGPSLASASLQSVAPLLQPLQGCPLPAGLGGLPGIAACLLQQAPSPLSSVWAEIGLLVS